jgi:cathepsin L
MLSLVVLSLLSVSHALPLAHEFDSWKLTHSKVYHPTEEVSRRGIFEDNHRFIKEYNARADTTMTLGLNRFADLTHEEFRNLMTGTLNQTEELKTFLEEEGVSYIPPEGIQLPQTVDWRQKGAVTPVKDQGQCGSCYSFSTTGSIEGQWQRKTHNLVSLSEQQIMDCSAGGQYYPNNGCYGGLMTSAFRYVKYAGGLDTEQSYPYEGQQGECRFRSQFVGAKIKGYSIVESKNEEALKSAVANVGPISVAIDASHRSLQFYSGGIYNEPACSSYQLDHAVLAVGYGTYGYRDYWIVKNSWGAWWGVDGFFLLERNRYNHCGIATMASYPLV